MKFIQDIKFYLVLSILLSIVFAVKYQSSLYREKELKNNIITLKHENDSLIDELLMWEIAENRIMTAHDIFYEINPKAMEQLDSIITNETE